MSAKFKEEYRIEFAIPKNNLQWRDYIDKSKDLIKFASPSFQYILSKAYGLDVLALLAKDKNGEIVGVLSCYCSNLEKPYREIHSPPYGLVVCNNSVALALFDAMKSFCMKNGIIKTQLEHPNKIENANCLFWSKKTILKSLASNVSEDWINLRGKTRNIIRKARKQDIQITNDFKYLDDWYEIYSERMLSMNIHTHPKQFFKLLKSELGNEVKFYIGRLDGEVIGGIIVLYSNDKAYYFFSAQSTKARSVGLNELLIWNLIEDCHKKGIKAIDLARSNPSSSVFNFKTRSLGGIAKDTYFYDLMSGEDQKSEVPSVPFIIKLKNKLSPYTPKKIKRLISEFDKKFEHLL